MLLKNSLAYIELREKKLTLGVLKSFQAFQDRYVFEIINFIDLEELDFYQNIVYNPSKIFLLIQDFVKENNIFNIFNCLVCLPNLNLEKQEQKLFLLQVILILGKLGLNIKKIINKNLIKQENNQNYLLKKEIEQEIDYYQKLINLNINNKSFFRWVKISIISFIILIIILLFFSFQKVKEIKKLEQENIILENMVLDSKSSLKDINSIKDKINREILFLDKINKITNNLNIPDNYLLVISESLPESVWLRNIKFNKKDIEIEGQALSEANITKFVQNLTKNGLFKVVSIENIEEVQGEKDNFLQDFKEQVYNFKLKLLL